MQNSAGTGLTKREHFAALAMQGLLANSRIDWQLTRPDQLGKEAVIQADALITALNEEPK